jgi:MFS family permease
LFKKEFAEGLRFIKNRKGLVPLITLATALNFLITPLDTLLPYFIKFNHFGGASELALVIACLQGGMLAGGVLMTATKGFKKKMVAAMLFIYVVNLGYGLVALTLTGAFLLMAIGVLIMGFGIAPVNVSIQTIVQTVVPMDMQGRVNSVMGAGAMAASPAGMMLSGALAGLVGTSNLLLACAVSGILLQTLSWLFTGIRYAEETKEEPKKY